MFAWFERRAGVTDVMLGAVALVLFGVADFIRDGASAALIDVIFAVAIVFWRRLPGLGLAIAWVGALAQIATIDGLLVGDLLILGAVFATGLAESKPVRWAGLGSSIIGGGVAGARLILYAPTYGDGSYIPTDPFYRMVYFVVVSGVIAAALALFWALGVLVRNRRGAAAVRLERERERIRAEATLTQERERALLSREMHDLVGHALAVVIAQSDGARYAKLTDPLAETTALATINRTARSALDDVHELLQVLRSPDDAERPSPGAADLDLLLAGVEDAGLNARLTQTGERATLSAAHELALYRVLQESLTNAIKHGGRDTAVSVELHWLPDSVEFSVLTVEPAHEVRPAAEGGVTGAARASAAASSLTSTSTSTSTSSIVTVDRLATRETGAGVRPLPGQGLIGMRERMRLLGGTVEAGPRDDGVHGFRVQGRLPFAAPEAGR